MPFWLLNLSESDRLICIPVRYLGKCTHLRKTPQILLSATLWINQLSILSSIIQTYIHMFLHHLTCFPVTHVLAVFISLHHHHSKKTQKMWMLSLSFFIQGSLWMLRLLFSIVRHIFSVAKVTSLWDCSFRVLNVIGVFKVLFGQVMSSHHSDQMSQRSQVSGVALWGCYLNVFVIVHVNSLSLPLFLSLSWWSGHVSSSLWLNFSKVKVSGVAFRVLVVLFNNMEESVRQWQGHQQSCLGDIS